METLVVTGRTPRSGRGAAGRTMHLLRELRAAGCQTHVVVVQDDDDAAAAPANPADLREVCRWLHVVPRDAGGGPRWLAWLRGNDVVQVHSREAVRTLEQLMPLCRLVVCCEAGLHPLVSKSLPPRLREGMANAQRPFYLVDQQEVLSRRLLADSQSCWGPRRWTMRADAARARALEIDAASQADLTLVSTHVDLQTLADRAPMATLWEMANGVDPDQVLSSASLDDLGDALMFLGDPSLPHHARAATWLARAVMPLVRRARDGARLHISGTHLPWSVRRLGRLPWIELHDAGQPGGQPTSVTMAKCVAGVASQRDARGVTDLVLNMMAAGRPVVTTMNVAMSLPGESAAGPTPLERAEPIADALVTLLRDRKQAIRQGQRCREFVASAATWDVQWRRLGALAQRLGEDHRLQVQSDSPGKRHPRVKAAGRNVLGKAS